MCRGITWIAGLAAMVVAMSSCRRREEGMFVAAPFNDETRIAKVEANWEPTATGFHFEVRVENRLADSLFVSIQEFALIDASGQKLATSAASRACVLPAHETRTVLSGDFDVGAESKARIAGFEVERFGVPLSERGRSIYREFLLQKQVRPAGEIDAELASYVAAPVCD